MDHYVIIVAGGSGKRMNADTPKQFITIHQKPIIFHTIEKFLAFDASIQFIIALKEEYIPLWKGLIQKHKFSFPHQIAAAGEERFHTVKNALELVPTHSFVGIHDAVRPLVSEETIENCVNGLKSNNAIVPVTHIIPSIRKINGENSQSIDRSLFRAVQTPQYFASSKIKAAYNTSYKPYYTDDASVYEQEVGNISLVNGNEENIKITTPKDLILAEFYLKG